MTVFVNGEARSVADDSTVADLVTEFGAPDRGGRGVAVALNGEVVARSQWATTSLAADDRLELLAAIGGG
jgi:sulfur carrier protein